MNNEDSRIRRLREYVNLYLRRYGKVDRNEKHGIRFLFEKSIIKSGKSKVGSFSEKYEFRSDKNKSNNAGNQKGIKKIKEEIGRSYHTRSNDPYSYDQILDDVKVELFPVGAGSKYKAIVRKGKQEYAKIFVTEEEAQHWARNLTQSISNKITQ